MSIVGDKLRAAIAETDPADALHLIAELCARVPHGHQGVGNPCISMQLGYSNEAYVLIAEMPGRHLDRDVRIASVQIGCLSIAASGPPKVPGPNDSQMDPAEPSDSKMVRPDGPVLP